MELNNNLDLETPLSHNKTIQETDGLHDFDFKSKESARNYPQCTQRNTIKTLATYILFLGAGMSGSILGATILQLEQQTNSSASKMASLFVWRAVGQIMGSITTTVLFTRIPPELLLAAAAAGLCGTHVVIPFCFVFHMLMIAFWFHGFTGGIVGSGCNAYILKTWRLRSASFVQMLHFMASFGSMATPLVLELWYQSERDKSGNALEDVTLKTQTVYGDYGEDSTVSTTLLGMTEDRYKHVNITISTPAIAYQSIYPPYFATAAVLLVATIIFGYSLTIDIISHRKQLNRRDSFMAAQKEATQPIKQKPIVAIICIFCCFYGGLEFCYGSWILTFCVKHIGLDIDIATLICTAFWGSLAVGRLIAIITSKYFKPEILNCIYLALATASLAFLTFTWQIHAAVMWVSSCLVGLSFSSIFGNTLTFSQRELNLSGHMTGLYVLSLYSGVMVLPAGVGLLMTKYSLMYFAWTMLAGTAFITVLFWGIILYLRIRFNSINKTNNK